MPAEAFTVELSKESARLAWLRHAASVSPEPGSNPSFKSYFAQRLRKNTPLIFQRTGIVGCGAIIPRLKWFVKAQNVDFKGVKFPCPMRGLKDFIPWGSPPANQFARSLGSG